MYTDMLYVRRIIGIDPHPSAGDGGVLSAGELPLQRFGWLCKFEFIGGSEGTVRGRKAVPLVAPGPDTEGNMLAEPQPAVGRRFD